MVDDEKDELSKFDDFWDDDNDEIRPIDMQDDKKLAPNPAPGPEDLEKDLKGRSGKEETPDPAAKPEDSVAPADQEGEPSIQPQRIAPEEPSNLDDVVPPEDERGRKALENSNSMVEERLLRDIDEEEAQKKQYVEIPDRTLIEKGEYFDLLAKDPTLHDLYIAAGWDQRSLEDAPADLDLSLFLLDKEDQTREDGDFVFYNNMNACDGAVRLREDSRTGAGDGDDERAYVDVNGVPFDVQKIRCVISVYDDQLVGFSFDKVRDVYLRVVNNSDEREIFCFELDAETIQGATAIEVGTLVREGPKWYFSADAKPVEGGLAAVAKSYGMLITEDTG
jgi:tellurium resistance protein TerD